MPEAPVSLNVRFVDREGYVLQLTMRSTGELDADEVEQDARALLGAWGGVRELLAKAGCSPAGSVTVTGNGGSGWPEKLVCDVHGEDMPHKKSAKGWHWYGHRVPGQDKPCFGSEEQNNMVTKWNKSGPPEA